MANFQFTNEHRMSDVGNIIGVLEKPRLWVPESDYPDYYYWLEKVESELGTQQKRAMLAYAGAVPVGVVLYQKHRTRHNTVEIKNISVSPDQRGRYVGSFLLKNAEVEALNSDYPECTSVVVDTKATNTGMVDFLVRHRYAPAGVTDLYGLGAGDDILFAKTLGQQ
ncbi:MAG: hypothetical protein JWO35_127 [Candidatus Saccharibacteria bacterium]|nr:hypothetical protein [Candidatus Saccharibacteria bacterium]